MRRRNKPMDHNASTATMESTLDGDGRAASEARLGRTEPRGRSGSYDASHAAANGAVCLEMKPLLAKLDAQSSDGGDSSDGARAPTPAADADLHSTDAHPAVAETAFSIGLQVCLPFLIAGFGMVGAGVVFDVVQHWPVFTNVSDIIILVPALLGLKGNLEMTLASRLSTNVNVMADIGNSYSLMILGNIAVTQGQAIIVGLLASCFAIVVGWIPERRFYLREALLLSASSVATASCASLVLGLIMCLVVIGSKALRLNPDNVATPIAASLGDLTTLAVLSAIASGLFHLIDTDLYWVLPLTLAVFVLLAPIWLYVALHNPFVKHVVYNGWLPILAAMVISSISGLILDVAVKVYSGIAVFQPVINGVGGNLVAVQASRLATAMHRVGPPGTPHPSFRTRCPLPWTAFFGSSTESRTSRVLLFLVIPGQCLFVYIIAIMQSGHTSVTIKFAAIYVTAAFIQVLLLLYLAHWLVGFVWRRGQDPDNVCIPYLTALGDLLGTALLLGAFHLLYLTGDHDMDVGD